MVYTSMSTTPSTSVGSPEPRDSSVLPRSASYLGCRHCGEGALVWDPEAEQSRCGCCGALD